MRAIPGNCGRISPIPVNSTIEISLPTPYHFLRGRIWMATLERILSFEDARHTVEEHAAELRPHGKELVELLDSAGEVLAEAVSADRNFPPFPRATRDGYAVRA